RVHRTEVPTTDHRNLHGGHPSDHGLEDYETSGPRFPWRGCSTPAVAEIRQVCTFDVMTSRGARLVVHASVTGLVVVGAAAPAAAGAPAAAAAGARDVAVLRLADGSGEPNDLTTAVADPRVGTPGVTAELGSPEFTAAGVTWAGRQAPDEEISTRVRTGEEWATWSGRES